MPYYDPQTAESEEQHYLKLAADEVQRLAPAPNPVTADYTARAARAERLLLNYLINTQGGSLSSVSGRAGSLAFVQFEVLQRRVRAALGPYLASDALTITTDSTFVV